MITCPSCSHQNPDNATTCEACYTPLPITKTISCPSCHATVQADASFCGHCGFNLQSAQAEELQQTFVLENPEVLPVAAASAPATYVPSSVASSVASSSDEKTEVRAPEPPPIATSSKTQLQQISASLLHVQTNITLEIPPNLQVIHIGKPNNMIPPDIDVSGFPDSDIVSRVHADIRFEGDAFYFEDTGSSNGTYINNVPLASGNRHRLRPGDRLSLGKGDKVSFIFQMS